MSMSGRYVVRSGDLIIGEFNNMLTTNGLLAINQYLSGQSRFWADTLVIGALSTSSTTASMTTLQYETYRNPVNFKSYQTVSGSNQIVLKATIDPALAFEAYEVGVVPSRVDINTYLDNYQISTFSETSSGSSRWVTNNAAAIQRSASPTPRTDTAQIVLPVTTNALTNTASISGLSVTATRYSEIDYVGILYYCAASFSAASVTVWFGDSGATTQTLWSGSTTVGSTASGSFYSASLSMGTKDPNFTDPISTASIRFYGSSGSVYLDQMKFILGGVLGSDQQLVSRTTSSSPSVPLFSKVYSQPMDIEYYIQVT